MKKQFLFNITLLVFLNALVKPFWVFGIDRSVQNLMGAEAYGLYFALFNVSLLFNIILDPGISNFNNRSIARNPGLIHMQFSRLLHLKLILGVVYIVICLGSAWVWGYSALQVKLLAILAFNQFLASLLLFLRSNVSGLQFFKADSLLSVADRFFMIVICSAVLWGDILPFRMDMEVFAFSQTAAYFLGCVVAAAFLFSKKRLYRVKGMVTSGLLRQSMPFALLALLMVVYTRLDAVLLSRMLPDGAVAAGIYAQSYRIFDAMNMIAVLFASLLLPMFAKLLAQQGEIRSLVALSSAILISGMTILAINLAVFSSPLLTILYHERYPESVSAFILLMFCIVPVSATYIFGTLLTAGGQLRRLNLIAAITLLTNILCNVILIPAAGVPGAAVSALISHLLAAVLQIIMCRKIYQLNLWGGKIKRTLLAAPLFVLIPLSVSLLTADVLVKLGVSVLLSALLLPVLKIIDFKEIKTMIKTGGI